MSKVVVTRISDRQDSSRLNKKEYCPLLEIGLQKLTGESDSVLGLNNIIEGDIVGLKLNCLTGKFNSTSIPLVEAVSDLLIKAGIKENNIVVWERSSRELKRAGYKLNASVFGSRVIGTDASEFGYSRDFYSYGKANSQVSQIMTEMIDSNINMPVLKDHSIAGLSGAMKNMYGAINNPNKYHGNNCDPYAADVSNLAPIRSKNRLIIMDADMVQYHAGPGYNSQYLHRYGGILLATDPVAIDRVGLKVVEHFRKVNKLPSLTEENRPAQYIETAEKNGLGTADWDKIDLMVIDVEEDGTVIEGSLL